MKMKLGLMAVLLCLLSAPVGTVSAIPTYQGCPPPSVSISGIPSHNSIWGVGGPRMGDEDVKNLHQLADHGIKIMYVLQWWQEPGIAYHNALDIFYNESFRTDVERVIDYNFEGIPPDFYHGEHAWSGLNPEKVWAVILSDEEPTWSYHWSDFYSLSDDVAKYSDIYYTETGFQLKSIPDMNETEQVVLYE